MQSFDSDGVEIAYLDEGEGEPILLIHGFASNVATNWVDPQWVRTIGNGTEFMVHPDVASAYARKSPEPKPSKRRGRAPRTTTEE